MSTTLAEPYYLSIRCHDLSDNINTTDVPDHTSLWGLMLPLRNSLCQYVNVRPTRILPGTTSPLSACTRGDLDWIIIRENSEGEYAGHGGITHTHFGNAVATDTSIYTQAGIERVMHFAFKTARAMLANGFEPDTIS